MPRELAEALARSPEHVVEHLSRALAGRPTGTEALLFVDQFEELFTTVAQRCVGPFIALLAAVAGSPNGRTVITMRSDFYHRCVDIPALAALLEQGQFPLSAPGDTLFDMIMRPAERAGLDFEEGLAGRILRDAGRDPGALPLLAYTLDELYRNRGGSRTLSHRAYERLGGVQGAVGTRAEDVFRHRLDDGTRASFSRVLRELVEIDEHGLLARRRVPLPRVCVDEHTTRFVEVFTEARLLVRSGEPGRRPVVFVAHEALFDSWARLREWIEVVRDDLRLLRRVRAAAREWDESGRLDAYRWQHERLEPVYETIERLDPDIDPVLAEFIRPEHERLLPVFRSTGIESYRRQAIMDRLVAIGAPAVPGLLDALRTDPVARDAASSTLARIGAVAIAELLRAATDEDAEVRLAALGALRQIDDPAVVPAFANGLRDQDTRVSSLAAGALAAIGGPRALAILESTIMSSKPDQRWLAVGTLGAFGEAAVGPLLRSMRDEDIRVRTDALAALEAIGATNLKTLIAALHDPDAGIRTAAAEALAGLGEPAELRLSIELDRTDDVDMRWRAIECLRSSGTTVAVRVLAKASIDDHPMVRRAAVEALSRIRHPDVIPVLVNALSDRSFEVGDVATNALASMGKRAVVPLRDVLLQSGRGPVRARAAAALAVAGPDGIRALRAALDSPRASARLRAVDALVTCGDAAVSGLLTNLRNPNRLSRDAATAALHAIGDVAVGGLLSLADDQTHGVRRAVATALGGSSLWQARSALLRMLGDEDAETRTAAAHSLAGTGWAALPGLLQAVQKPDVTVRNTAAMALRIMGEDAVRSLIRLVDGNDQTTRELATAALIGIGTPAALFGLAERGIFAVNAANAVDAVYE